MLVRVSRATVNTVPSRPLQIVIVRVYRSSNRELTYGVLRLATPAQLFSTYATLVDVCASGVSVSSVWRDGLKEREFLLTHGLPALAETKQHSNWVVDPAIKEASAAPMRCVAEAVTCSDVRVSTDYAMTPLDGQGLDGRLSAPCKLPISSGGKDRLVKNFGGSSVSTEGMTGLLKSLNCSSSKAIETLHVSELLLFSWSLLNTNLSDVGDDAKKDFLSWYVLR